MTGSVNWFTDVRGTKWTPKDGYNAIFRDTVRMVRAFFGLQKVGPGVDTGTGKWIEYNLPEGTAYVCIDEFVWDKYVKDHGSISPRFFLKFRMAAKPDGKKEFFNDELVIEFSKPYPAKRPYVKLSGKKYQLGGAMGSHEYHQFSGNWLCLDGDEAWDGEKDTVITIINWALEWALMYYNK